MTPTEAIASGLRLLSIGVWGSTALRVQGRALVFLLLQPARGSCHIDRWLDSAGAPLCHCCRRPDLPQLSFHTPLGAISVSEEDGALVALDWGWGRDQDATALLCAAREQLQAYFDGTLARFSLPLALAGTVYRKRVWLALADIPFGQTRSYGVLAARVGGSARAVGGAVGRNPLPIILPCHRVVGAAGLGGYSGGEGLNSKRALLRLEQCQGAALARAVGSTANPHAAAAASTGQDGSLEIT